MPAARLVTALLLTVLVASCSSAGGDLPTPEQPGTVDPTPASGTTGADCSPSHRVTVTSRRPRVLYALRFALAPGERGRGDQDAALYTYPTLSAGIFVTGPGGVRLDPRTSNALLAEVPQGTPLLDGVRGLSWDLRNTGPRRSRYLVYAGATVYTAHWTARTCTGPPERIEGTLVLIGRIRDGVERCGEARPAGRLRRVALVTSCHRDTLSARQFRDPGD